MGDIMGDQTLTYLSQAQDVGSCYSATPVTVNSVSPHRHLISAGEMHTQVNERTARVHGAFTSTFRRLVSALPTVYHSSNAGRWSDSAIPFLGTYQQDIYRPEHFICKDFPPSDIYNTENYNQKSTFPTLEGQLSKSQNSHRIPMKTS